MTTVIPRFMLLDCAGYRPFRPSV